MSVQKEPAQTFCSCGKPLILWNPPYMFPDQIIPIEWIENGCDECQKKLNLVKYHQKG